MAEMTVAALEEACKKNGGYKQPRLNDQLFLQCRGFSEIKNLDPYVNLKVLWLEQNAISRIVNVSHLEHLASLFLQNNAIREISGLDGLHNLRTLNLSHNYITRVENLSCCPLLETLQLSHNRLESMNDIRHIQECPSLSCVDLSFNRIARSTEDSDSAVVDFFVGLPALSVLYLHGNEIISKTKSYRRNMVARIKQLAYLDERPVFPEERRTIEAWARGGTEAEDEERAKIQQEKKEHLESCVTTMQQMAAATKDLREKRERDWEARKQQERELHEIHRESRKKAMDDLNADESEGRLNIDVEETGSWERHLQDEEESRASAVDAAADHLARQQQTAVEQAVKEELDEQQRLITEAARRSEEEEKRRWVQQFIKEDEDIERGFAESVEALMAGLKPGPAPARPAVPQLPPDTVAAKPKVEKRKAKNANSQSYWEAYYQWELAAAKKFA